jgi:hypothetical protein
MQLPHFQTPGAFLKQYFQNNPDRLKSYVGLGVKIVNLATSPLGVLLKHLIEIQGMDPNTEPGRRAREQFQRALDSTFEKFHNHEYDSDFDFSWLSKKFEEARKSNGQSFDLSKEEFRNLTDVSNLKATPPFAAPATRITTEAGVPVTIDQSPVDEIASLLDVPVDISALKLEPARDAFNKESWLKAYGDIHANPPRLELPEDRNELKDALRSLVNFAKSFEEEHALEPSKLMARTQELKNLKKTLERYGAPSRSIKKAGKIRRIPTGKVDAIKATPKKSPKPVKKTLNRITLSQPVVDYEKEADEIQRLIKFQKLEPRELDLLVSEGLDSKSVDAWKTKYGDKHFTEGSTLKQNLKAKHTAATDLANEMVARGLCDKSGVSEQVAEILKLPEETFHSMKKVVMNRPVLNLRADGKDLFRLEVLEKKQELSDKKFRSGKGSFRRSAQKTK